MSNPAPPPPIINIDIQPPQPPFNTPDKIRQLHEFVDKLKAIRKESPGSISDNDLNDWLTFYVTVSSPANPTGGIPPEVPAWLTAACQPGGLLSNMVDNAITNACQPGGSIDNAIHNAITNACQPGGSIDNAITNACQPGGSIDNAITNACQPGGSIDNAITNACQPGGSFDKLLSDRLSLTEKNVVVRVNNLKALQDADNLLPIETANGIPPNFPVTRGALRQLNSVDVNAILGFYGLPVTGQLAAKRNRILLHIGSKRL